MVNVNAQCASAGARAGWTSLAPFGVVSVTDYGATGNGVTEDTAGIHAAILAAGTNGTVYFPPGTYVAYKILANVAGQSLVLHPNATIKFRDVGAPWAATDWLVALWADGVSLSGGFLDATANNYDTASQDISQYTIVKSVGFSRITVSDTIISHPTSMNAGGVRGAFLSNGDDLNILRVKATNCALGIQNTNRASALIRARVQDCIVDFTSATAAVDAQVCFMRSAVGYTIKEAEFSGNRVYGPNLAPTSGNGAAINGQALNDVIVRGNYCFGWPFGITMSGCVSATVTGNTMINTGNRAIEIGSFSTTEVVSGCFAITGNTVDNTNIVGGVGNGIGYSGSSGNFEHVTITGNTFKAVDTGFEVGGGNQNNSTYKYLAITGNTVSTVNTNCNGLWLRESGAGQNSLTSGTFSGNVISMSSQTGCYGVHSKMAINGLSVTGNTFVDIAGAALRFEGTAAGDAVSNVNASGNTLVNTATLRSTSFSGGAAFGSNVVFQNNITTGTDVTIPRVKAGTPSDADFDTPITGMVVVDTTGNKIWVRTGSATWKSVTIA